MEYRPTLIRLLSLLLATFLALQYLLGMLVNFYVSLDGVHIPGNTLPEVVDAAFTYASTAGGTLTAHWLNATVLLILALALLAIGLRGRLRWLWAHATLVVLMIMAGAFGGAAFVGYQNDGFSLLMALAFLFAFAVSLSMCFMAFRPPST